MQQDDFSAMSNQPVAGQRSESHAPLSHRLSEGEIEPAQVLGQEALCPMDFGQVHLFANLTLSRESGSAVRALGQTDF